ncbi:hypothetical protein M3J09_005645 [Ascochyta lentis]
MQCVRDDIASGEKARCLIFVCLRDTGLEMWGGRCGRRSAWSD